jgi:hypothetical protein
MFCAGAPAAADGLEADDELDAELAAGAALDAGEADAGDEVEAMTIRAGCTADAGESDCPGSADGFSPCATAMPAPQQASTAAALKR